MSSFANPEAKTRNLFNREVEELDTRLPGVIVILENGARLRIDRTQPWFKDAEKVISRTDLGKLQAIHRPGIERLRPGDVWISPLKFRRMDQTLVVAQDRGEVAACVRVVRASGSEVGSDDFTSFENEGDTAKFLIKNGGLQKNWIGRLRFLDVLDDELSLQVLGPFEDVSRRRLSFDEANQALNDFFIEV